MYVHYLRVVAVRPDISIHTRSHMHMFIILSRITSVSALENSHLILPKEYISPKKAPKSCDRKISSCCKATNKLALSTAVYLYPILDDLEIQCPCQRSTACSKCLKLFGIFELFVSYPNPFRIGPKRNRSG